MRLPPMTQSRADTSLPEIRKTLVLVGLMGAGKSCIGRRLAARLDLPFVDADREIEEAAGCSIPEIFERHGEQAFRDGERRVILRLLEGPVCVLATGGGAFMDTRTRAAVHDQGVSIWLRADLDLLSRRVSRRNDRPLLLVDDPRRKLEELMAVRHPVYAEADITVDSQDGPPEATLDRVMAGLAAHLADGARTGAVASVTGERATS
jgi:shikimate kinase